MHEIEIKLSVGASRRDRVVRELQRGVCTRTHLVAVYFDTEDHALAGEHIALRLRKEGRRWVQTVKAMSDLLAVRLEHNVPLPEPTSRGPRGCPQPDLRLHRGTPVAARMHQALKHSAAAALSAQYRTDIWRLQRHFKTRQTDIEVALDQGRITADGPRKTRALEVCELEIECLSGDPRVMLDVAERWVRRHGLWLDTRSKAQRGEVLARGAPARASPARPPQAEPGHSLASAWLSLNRGCMSSVLDNASQLAAGANTVEHVHQLRVGLNRLRTLWRLFRGSGFAPEAALAQRVDELFRALGLARDRSVWDSWQTRLRQARGVELAAQLNTLLPVQPDEDPCVMLRSTDINVAWLQWLRLGWGEPADGTPAPCPPAATSSTEFERYAKRRLRRWQQDIIGQIEHFDQASDNERHRLRKCLKRLRYSLEMLAPTLSARALRDQLTPLRKAENHLGEFNDLVVCMQLLESVADHHAAPRQALLWLAEQRKKALKKCARSLRAYAQAPCAVLKFRA